MEYKLNPSVRLPPEGQYNSRDAVPCVPLIIPILLLACFAFFLSTSFSATPAPNAFTPPVAPSIAAPLSPVLLSAAQVDKSGIYLDQLATVQPPAVLPHVRIASAPPLNQPLTVSRLQLQNYFRQNPATALLTNWSGASQITISRRSRHLSEKEIKDLLTAELQKDFLKNQGTLELRLEHPWAPLLVPDEPLSVKVFDLPPAGVTASFILRFTISDPDNQLGSWQVPVQASLYKDVIVARGHLRRGEILRSAETAVENRDALAIRDPLDPGALENAALELTENIAPNMPILARSVRLRPLIKRGAIIEAVLQDGPLNISLKVQALEDGLPGQTVRVRNIKSKHEFYGKVQNETTVAIAL